jgi:hypothetical protein
MRSTTRYGLLLTAATCGLLAAGPAGAQEACEAVPATPAHHHLPANAESPSRAR